MRLIIMVVMISTLAAAPEKKPSKKTANQAPKSEAALTGCLDQQGERYVVSSETDMKKLFVLSAKSFSNDNFARYIGHKVTVHGRHDGESFEVVRIEDVAETCSR
jgi:hypothetical protein